jgi:hypothetical protein
MSDKPYRILVTGSRDWDDMLTIRDAIAKVRTDDTDEPIVVVHGACPKGADAIAAYLVDKAYPSFRMSAEAHPADWQAEPRRGGFIRNELMVNLGADVCLAFIKNGSKGASHTAGLAEKAGIETRRFTA